MSCAVRFLRQPVDGAKSAARRSKRTALDRPQRCHAIHRDDQSEKADAIVFVIVFVLKSSNVLQLFGIAGDKYSLFGGLDRRVIRDSRNLIIIVVESSCESIS
ncbi:uncharacterized protein LOC105424970 [Pogonomyrmex barbatus]|uniref:Uncharacterized protein LOC105424970 n=1 Tax=Pogonomyrmex barbatus TaxID=144034 RepID=A0A6I9VZ65_9HYME|nr:uncharacterized protein LOC105424970 [Pogonomyrmex barbatus]